MSPGTQWLVAKERLRQRPAAPTPLFQPRSVLSQRREMPGVGGAGRGAGGSWTQPDPRPPSPRALPGLHSSQCPAFQWRPPDLG